MNLNGGHQLSARLTGAILHQDSFHNPPDLPPLALLCLPSDCAVVLQLPT